ncbi:P-type conjugative transfer protein TrbJ [Nitrosomonas communis]|uniref:P-type conjugative transfer protein TrbJ n=1 Tax=Nitrosomonas communis TaxID=44574 RepID=UPI003D276268
MFNSKTLVISLVTLVILIRPGAIPQTLAGGIPVIDAANVHQSTISAVENVSQTLRQIQQYQTQLQQYENMIRNTLSPPLYIWSDAQRTMNNLMTSINTLRYYKDQLGGLDNYLSRYKNPDYYRNSPCLVVGNCSQTEWKLLREGEIVGADAQKRANDAMFRGLDQQQDSIVTDAMHLEQLQTKAESAVGQMQAIQYANQLAGQQANQLLQLRAMFIAQHNAINTRNQAIADQEARWMAAHEAAAKRLSPESLPPSRTWNVGDTIR